MNTIRKVILAKIESTYNVDPTPAAANDAVLVEEPQVANEGLIMIERKPVRTSQAPLQFILGGRLGLYTCEVEVKGSGTAGTPPEIDPLLRACGFQVANVPATSDIYTPRSTGHESITLYVYEDGTLTKLTGCRGNVSFKLAANDRVMASFNIVGHISARTDAALPTPTLDSTQPVPFNGASFTVDSFAGEIENLNFDMGNKMATPKSVNASDGFGEIQITARDVNGSIDPEDELVATEDWIGNFTSGASMAIAVGAIGSVAGNILTPSFPATYYRDVSRADKDGIAALELPFGAVESSGDDEVSLAFT